MTVTRNARRRDDGMSLVEVLVAATLFGVLGTLLLGLAISTSAVTQDTKSRTDVTGEARTALERMTRELRQSAGLDAVTLPGDGTATSFTFWTDFDGDGFRDQSASDPEVLTYCWSTVTDELTLNDDADCDAARPVLAGKVSSLQLELDSSEWAYDADGNGTTTWQELDAKAGLGNDNHRPDGAELLHIDLVGVTLVVRDGTGGAQTFHTSIDLRNRI
ncbi:prepilin-type N-terminal cleavage/methylation domain-containing protein [Nocardioides sp. URHA0032]|uniref:prepilin-type N-terminal cleavage/methylation domain-containing protein n=1 Tax=Nocardioides sp. URHA0032 TaxID=1380388 RepID=UPI000491D0B4|nr:prepilin-type N-terminal cleavage/methylation domain-containing protein [Nocardioides sp. URHA0032]